jgi:hypothetical protein
MHNDRATTRSEQRRGARVVRSARARAERARIGGHFGRRRRHHSHVDGSCICCCCLDASCFHLFFAPQEDSFVLTIETTTGFVCVAVAALATPASVCELAQAAVAVSRTKHLSYQELVVVRRHRPARAERLVAERRRRRPRCDQEDTHVV